MKKELCNVDDVRAFWLYDGELYTYFTKDDSLKGNRDAGTLRVMLTDPDRPDEDVEVIFVPDDAGCHFRQDDSGRRYPLQRFDSESGEEFILYYENLEDGEIIYFNLA